MPPQTTARIAKITHPAIAVQAACQMKNTTNMIFTAVQASSPKVRVLADASIKAVQKYVVNFTTRTAVIIILLTKDKLLNHTATHVAALSAIGINVSIIK